MANEPKFKDAEEREIARGGRPTAFLTVGLMLFVVLAGLALMTLIRRHVYPPARPGTTSATTTAGVVKPPSP